MTATERIDPYTAVGAGERLETYAALAAAGPVQRVPLPNGPEVWLVSGYAEVRQVLCDERLVKAPGPAGRLFLELTPEVAPAIRSHLLACDGADHARLRRLVGAAFTARRSAQLAPRIQEIADGLLDALDPTSEVDLIASFAYPLPMTVICELIGVPEADREDFRVWTEAIAAAPFVDLDVFATAVRAEVAFARRLVQEKREQPADDLLSALVAVRDAGDRLSDDELTSMMWLLTVAGHETTVNLIANGVHALLTHPAQFARLRAEPDLLPKAVEEMLRFEGPVQSTFPLLATEPLRVGGVDIAAGDLVVAALLPANRDRVQLDDPDVLDLVRSPNSHLAFGHGIHYCVGAPLARLEARIALSALLERFPRLSLASPAEKLTWRPNFLFHGLSELPVFLR